LAKKIFKSGKGSNIKAAVSKTDKGTRRGTKNNSSNDIRKEEMNQKLTIEKEEVSMLRKLAYSIRAIGGEFVYSMIGLYLMYFFTDVALIGAALGGTIMLVSRLWDGFADFFMGFLADKVKNKKIYVFTGMVPLGLSFCMLFQTFDMSLPMKEAYYFVFAILTWSFFTFVDMPLGSMLPNMTMNAHERTKISAMTKFFSLVTLMVIGGAFWPVVKILSDDKNQAPAFSTIGIVVGLIIVAVYMISGIATREKYVVPPEQRYKFKEGFKLIKQNRPYLVLLAAVFIEFIVFTSVGMVLNYYFKYVVHNETLMSFAMVSLIGFAAISMPIWVFISKKIGKKKVYQYSFILYGIVLTSIFFITPKEMITLVPVFIVAGSTFGGLSLSFMSTTPDTVDYGQWKTGARCEGFQFGIYAFVIKLSGSVASFIVGTTLDFAGYKANVEQTESSILAILILMTLFPGMLCFIGAFIMRWYNLDNQLHQKICDEIGKRD
jgi:GPH family glycoside/pentoside/hexuronide:cation symporter